LLSLAASSALARCLRAFVGGVELKWPNDVLIGGRKVAGILVETVDSPDSPPAAVIGVGVNVGRDSIPSGMEDSATSLFAAAGSAVSMQAILGSFLREFQEAYLLVEAGRHCEVVGQWMSMAPMSRNARVWLEEGNRRREAITCGLTELGELRVRFPDGSDATVLAADVSLRPLGPVIKCQ
jgi:BirA family biotin operon repressor/biotin-[acetyl-CoA-carboxylase] ligase